MTFGRDDLASDEQEMADDVPGSPYLNGSTHLPDATRIPNTFRMQTIIEEEMAHVNALLAQNNNDLAELSGMELIYVGLVYLEVGNWEKVTQCVQLAMETEAKDNDEAVASGYYMFATKLREMNQCDEALQLYLDALLCADDPWLKANITRNIGLVYLKQKEFNHAAARFKAALDYSYNYPVLRGSIPALYNYYGLALARAALKEGTDPQEGLNVLEHTTNTYNLIFNEKGITTAEQRNKSHDWQSHQYHRGLVLCEIVECERAKATSRYSEAELQGMLEKAETLLLGSLAGRMANKADDQRLGDVLSWITRVNIQLQRANKANEYFIKALTHFAVAFPKATVDAPDAPQIVELKQRMEARQSVNHYAGLASPVSSGNGVFRPASPTQPVGASSSSAIDEQRVRPNSIS